MSDYPEIPSPFLRMRLEAVFSTDDALLHGRATREEIGEQVREFYWIREANFAREAVNYLENKSKGD